MKEDNNLFSTLRQNFYISIIFLIILLLFNFVVWQVNKSHYIGKAKDMFNEYSRDIKLLISRDLESYYHTLLSNEAFFKSHPAVTRSEFESFNATSVDKNNTSVPAIELIAYVQKTDDKTEFEKKIRAEQTNPPLQNYAFTVYPAGDQSQSWVINYMTPKNRNRSYFGYDVLTDSEFSSDFMQAAETGKMVVTNRKILIDKETILLIKPVYINNMPARTQDERVKALSGFVVIFLNPEDLFAKTADDIEEDYQIGLKVSIGHLRKNQIQSADSLFEDARAMNLLSHERDKMFETLTYGTFADKEITILTTAVVSEQLGVFEGIVSDAIFAISNLITIVFFLLVAEINNRDPEKKQTTDTQIA